MKAIDDSQSPRHIDIGLGQNNAFATALVTDAAAAGKGPFPFDQLLTDDNGIPVVKLANTETPIPLEDASVLWLNDSSELVMKGIYKIKHDELTYSWSAPGGERPTTFKVASGSKQTVVRLERFSTGERDIEALLEKAGATIRKDDVGWITSVSIQKQAASTLLTAIVPLQKLDMLHINDGGLTPADFTTVAQMQALRTLELRADSGSLSGLEAIAVLPSLYEVTLAGAAVTDETLSHVAQAQQIQRLRLKTTSVTDSGVELLSPLKLKMLQVTGVGITDASVASIVRNSPEITGLLLDQTNITDAGAKQLASLDQLDFLRIPRTKITDTGIASLARLPKLANLYMNDTDVTDAALLAIASGMPKLIMLDVRNNPNLTDAGLLALAEHPALVTIHVSRGQFSESTVEHVRQINGRLHVH